MGGSAGEPNGCPVVVVGALYHLYCILRYPKVIHHTKELIVVDHVEGRAEVNIEAVQVLVGVLRIFKGMD